MRARMVLISAIPVLLLGSPASALTKAQKMATCKFGADDQKLVGAKRNAFISRCMSNKDDKRGRVTPSGQVGPSHDSKS